MFSKIMKSKILFFLSFFWIFWLLFAWYQVNSQNYKKLQEIQASLIKHPELLPKKEIAKYTSFGFKNTRADIYWLKTIQYIGGNAVGSDYKKYLFPILDLITDLNPYFEKPYLIGQLLLPEYNQRYEELSKEDQEKFIKQWAEIGLKGIKNFCDAEKIEKIFKEDNLEKLFGNQTLRNPCKTPDIAFQQGFLNYFYLKDSLQASNYYKVASMIDGSPEGAKIMAAIMKGKSGDREKSLMMFLNLAKATNETDNPACLIVSNELETISYAVFQQGFQLNGELIKKIQDVREEYFTFDDSAEQDIIQGNNCNNYVNKAIRELNLAYIDQANALFFKENWENARTDKELKEKWYIDFLPTDFQQYDTYGISYHFNEEIGRFDYEMVDK